MHCSVTGFPKCVNKLNHSFQHLQIKHLHSHLFHFKRPWHLKNSCVCFVLIAVVNNVSSCYQYSDLICHHPQRQRSDTLQEESIKVHLMLMRTSPFLKIKSRMFSCVTSWKLALFSLAKKRSGFHRHLNIFGSTVSESDLKSWGSRSLGSFQRCLKKMLTR